MVSFLCIVSCFICCIYAGFMGSITVALIGAGLYLAAVFTYEGNGGI